MARAEGWEHVTCHKQHQLRPGWASWGQQGPRTPRTQTQREAPFQKRLFHQAEALLRHSQASAVSNVGESHQDGGTAVNGLNIPFNIRIK